MFSLFLRLLVIVIALAGCKLLNSKSNLSGSDDLAEAKRIALMYFEEGIADFMARYAMEKANDLTARLVALRYFSSFPEEYEDYIKRRFQELGFRDNAALSAELVRIDQNKSIVKSLESSLVAESLSGSSDYDGRYRLARKVFKASDSDQIRQVLNDLPEAYNLGNSVDSNSTYLFRFALLQRMIQLNIKDQNLWDRLLDESFSSVAKDMIRSQKYRDIIFRNFEEFGPDEIESIAGLHKLAQDINKLLRYGVCEDQSNPCRLRESFDQDALYTAAILVSSGINTKLGTFDVKAQLEGMANSISDTSDLIGRSEVYGCSLVTPSILHNQCGFLTSLHRSTSNNVIKEISKESHYSARVDAIQLVGNVSALRAFACIDRNELTAALNNISGFGDDFRNIQTYVHDLRKFELGKPESDQIFFLTLAVYYLNDFDLLQAQNDFVSRKLNNIRSSFLLDYQNEINKSFGEMDSILNKIFKCEA